MRQIRLALIGAGNHSRGNHAASLSYYAHKHPGTIELAAVCDLVEEKAQAFADQFGFRKVYTNYREMIEDEHIDACVCVMPIKLIPPLAIDLMKRGMPVTIEKPMGGSLAEVREIVKTAEQTGTPNMVSVNRRFDPLIHRGVQWAKEQGNFRYIRASILRHNRREEEFVSGTAIHCIDTLRSIGGEIKHYRSFIQDGQPRWMHVVFDFESGALGTLDILPTDGCVEERYEIFGDGFRMDVCAGTSPHPALRCWKENALVVDEQASKDQPPFISVGAYAETAEFVTAIAEGRAPCPSAAQVYPSVELAFKLDPDKPKP